MMGITLDAIAVDVFQKVLHGFIRLTDVVLKRKLGLAGRAVHIDFVAGAGDMQGRAAGRAYECSLDITGYKKSHGDSLC